MVLARAISAGCWSWKNSMCQCTSTPSHKSHRFTIQVNKKRTEKGKRNEKRDKKEKQASFLSTYVSTPPPDTSIVTCERIPQS